MRLVVYSLPIGLWLAGAALGQSTPVRIETAPLRLIDPDPYQVTAVLEPIRRVRIVAPIDGMIRGVERPARDRRPRVPGPRPVRPQRRPTRRLQVATAELKAKRLTAQKSRDALDAAEVEAAEARVEAAQAEVRRCEVRRPFAGRVFDVPVYPGQFVLKGTTIVELADTSNLSAVLPVDRRTVAVGSTVTCRWKSRRSPARSLRSCRCRSRSRSCASWRRRSRARR